MTDEIAEREEKELTVLDALRKSVQFSLLKTSPALWQVFQNWCRINELDPGYVLAERVYRWFNPDDPHAEDFGKEVASCDINLSLLTRPSSTKEEIDAFKQIVELRVDLAKALSTGDSSLKDKVYQKLEQYITPTPKPINQIGELIKKAGKSQEK